MTIRVFDVDGYPVDITEVGPGVADVPESSIELLTPGGGVRIEAEALIEAILSESPAAVEVVARIAKTAIIKKLIVDS